MLWRQSCGILQRLPLLASWRQQVDVQVRTAWKDVGHGPRLHELVQHLICDQLPALLMLCNHLLQHLQEIAPYQVSHVLDLQQIRYVVQVSALDT